MKCKKIFALLLSLCMIASSFIAMPVSAATENVIDISLPLDDASELTWLASSAVTVSNADGIGGRDDVVKAEGLANSNNNSVGVRLPDGFAFAEGDVLTYSIDVYSETAVNPDMWLRNHDGTNLNPVATFYHETLATGEWTTITKTLTYADMVAASLAMNSSGAYNISGKYALYIRPRSNATLYLDNFDITVAREVVEMGKVVDITVDSAADITWLNGGAAADADGIGGRDGVIALTNLANANGNTAGVKLPDGFAFKDGDVLTYSADVYSNGTQPDLWLRDHGDLAPFVTFYHEVTANTWASITRTVTYAEMVEASKNGGSTGDFGTAGNFALYFRPRNASTIYVDNFKVTVSRVGYVEPKPEVRGNVIDIDAPLNKASELTWIASDAVKASAVDGIGGRDDVIKVEGLADSNNNTAGIKLPKNFGFKAGDVITFSVDVYTEASINPDLWLRNHGSALTPYTTFYNGLNTAGTWATYTKTVKYEELGGVGDWSTVGDFAFYIRPRSSATVYLDNISFEVSRLDYTGEPVQPEIPHEHDYVGVVTTPATHLAEGVKTYTCDCGDSYTETIAKIADHAWDEGVITTPATHLVEGVKTYTCECGETKTEAIAKLEGHTWDAGVVTKEPTVDEEGVKTYTCACGEQKTEAIEKLPPVLDVTTISVANVETEVGKQIVVPVSISKNTIGLTGLTLHFTYDADVFKYVSAVQGSALTTLTLTKPGSAYTEGDLTFNWDNMDADFSNGEILLITFDVVETAPEGVYNFNVAVETACDFDMNDVETAAVSGKITVKLHEHAWDEGVVITPATHTQEGSKLVTCACGETATVVIDKLPEHTWDDGVVTLAPTHLTEGVKTFTCECGATYTEPVEKLAAHEYDEGAITTPATHLTEGVKTFTCPCGATYTETIDKLPDHEWDEGVITTPATHLTEGVKTYTCPCGEQKTEAVAKLPEHEYDEGVVTKEATHLEDGVKTYTCACGDSYTEVIPADADAHTYDDGVITTPATHMLEGVKTYTCACGDTYTETIAKLADHEWDAGVVVTAATCATDGVKKFTCPCGETKTEVIPATGAHAWGNGVITLQPTQNAEGIKSFTCSTCGEKKTETIDKIQNTDDVTSLTVANAKARAGREVIVPVTLANNTGLAGLTISVAYDSSILTLVEATKGSALASLDLTGPETISTNPATFLWDGLDADSSNGEVLVLKFNVADTATIGETEVSVTVKAACDQNLNDVIVCANNGTLKVTTYKAGDVDDDGEIDVKDVISVRRFVVGGYGVEINEEAADVYKDSVIELKDIVTLRRYIAGGYGVELGN